MTKDEIDKIPRKSAQQLLAAIPFGRGYDDRVILAIEQALNLEWWRGRHAELEPENEMAASASAVAHENQRLRAALQLIDDYYKTGGTLMSHVSHVAKAALSGCDMPENEWH